MAQGGSDLGDRVENLEKAMEVQTATQAGAHATQAAAQAGLTGAVVSGSAGFVAGMLLGVLLARA